MEEVLQRPNFRGVDGKEVHDCREDVKATMDIVAWLKNSFDQLFQFFPCQVFRGSGFGGPERCIIVLFDIHL